MNRQALRAIGLSFIVCNLSFSPAEAQNDDFGIWTEANIEKKINNRLALDGGLELRTRDDGFGELDRWSAAVGVEYKLTEWLKASVGYTLLSDHNHKTNDKVNDQGIVIAGTKYADYWGLRHRLSLSLTASQQFGDLSISLRERWQYTYRPEKTVQRYWNYDDEDEDIVFGEPVPDKEGKDPHTYNGKGSNKWRNRLQMKYKITKQWRPYLSAESTVGGSGLDKIRYTAGTEWRLNKHHSFDLHYMYQHAYKDDTEGNRHALGIGYTYKF
jgi:hypothetical protein